MFALHIKRNFCFYSFLFWLPFFFWFVGGPSIRSGFFSLQTREIDSFFQRFQIKTLKEQDGFGNGNRCSNWSTKFVNAKCRGCLFYSRLIRLRFHSTTSTTATWHMSIWFGLTTIGCNPIWCLSDVNGSPLPVPCHWPTFKLNSLLVWVSCCDSCLNLHSSDSSLYNQLSIQFKIIKC